MGFPAAWRGQPRARGPRRRVWFQEQQDHARIRVVNQQVHQFATPRSASLPTDTSWRNPAARGAARQDRADDGAALRYHARRVARQRIHFEHRVDSQRGAVGDIHQSDAIRSEQAHAQRSRLRDQQALSLRAFGTGLGESVAIDRGHRHAARRALLQRASTCAAGTMMNAWSMSRAHRRDWHRRARQHFGARRVDRHDAPA